MSSSPLPETPPPITSGVPSCRSTWPEQKVCESASRYSSAWPSPSSSRNVSVLLSQTRAGSASLFRHVRRYPPDMCTAWTYWLPAHPSAAPSTAPHSPHRAGPPTHGALSQGPQLASSVSRSGVLTIVSPLRSPRQGLGQGPQAARSRSRSEAPTAPLPLRSPGHCAVAIRTGPQRPTPTTTTRPHDALGNDRYRAASHAPGVRQVRCRLSGDQIRAPPSRIRRQSCAHFRPSRSRRPGTGSGQVPGPVPRRPGPLGGPTTMSHSRAQPGATSARSGARTREHPEGAGPSAG